MALTLATARAFLVKTILHAGNETYSDERLDYAIRVPLNIFARTTKCVTTTTDVSIASGATSFDPTDEIAADFVEDDLLDNCTINGYRVALAPELGTVQRRYEGGNPTANRPRMMAVRADDEVLFDCPTDQAYTLKVTHASGLVEWTAGTSDAVTINVPQDWAELVISTGSKRMLLEGVAFAHPDVPKFGEFWEVVERGKQHFARSRTGASA